MFTYSPETGEFRRIISSGSRRPSDGIGTVAGARQLGYCIISFTKNGKRKFYKAHRLAWLYMTGEWPKTEIDHINTNRFDNRWCNLREALRGQNRSNTSVNKNNKSGFKGVYWSKKAQKWESYLRKNKKPIWLGYFDTAKEASSAYAVAAQQHHGEFARY